MNSESWMIDDVWWGPGWGYIHDISIEVPMPWIYIYMERNSEWGPGNRDNVSELMEPRHCDCQWSWPGLAPCGRARQGRSSRFRRWKGFETFLCEGRVLFVLLGLWLRHCLSEINGFGRFILGGRTHACFDWLLARKKGVTVSVLCQVRQDWPILIVA